MKKENKNYTALETGIWPCTIISDRFDGQHSYGKWLAFNMLEKDIPKGVQGNDEECIYYWNQNNIIVGRGDTPTEAYNDLYNKLNK